MKFTFGILWTFWICTYLVMIRPRRTTHFLLYHPTLLLLSANMQRPIILYYKHHFNFWLSFNIDARVNDYSLVHNGSSSPTNKTTPPIITIDIPASNFPWWSTICDDAFFGGFIYFIFLERRRVPGRFRFRTNNKSVARRKRNAW